MAEQLFDSPHAFFGKATSHFKILLRSQGMKSLSLAIVMVITVFRMAPAQHVLSQTEAARKYERAVELFAIGNYGSAIQLFREFLWSSSGSLTRHAEAEYYAALCAVRLYHPDGEKQLEQVVARYAHLPQAALATFDLGDFFYTAKQYEKAADSYNRGNLSALTPERQSEVRFRWGYSLFNLKKLADANQQFAFVKNQGGAYGPAASYYAGFIQYQEREYDAALTDLRRAESNPSYASVVPHLITAALFFSGQYDEVIRYGNSLNSIANLTNENEIRLFVAESQFNRKNYMAAFPAYRDYLEANAQADQAVYYRAGLVADESRKPDEAIAYLKRAALATDTLGAFASYRLGYLYLKLDQKPQALAAYESAAKSGVNQILTAESEFQAGKLLYDLGRPDEAIARLEKFILRYADSPRITEVKEILSQAYVNANNFNKAIAYIESLPRRGPAIDQAYQKATYLKATELYNQERYPEAIDFFKKSIAYPIHRPILAAANFWCGEAFSLGRKYAEAVPFYKAAVEANADPEITAGSHYGLGYAWYNQQDYPQAARHFRQLLDGGRTSAARKTDALVRLADCSYLAKNYADALALYQQAVQQKSSDSDYCWLQTGIINSIERRYDEALADLDRVLANPSRYQDDARFNRGQIQFEQGKYRAAVSDYTQLIQVTQPGRFEPYALMRRAAANYNLKEYGQAADDYILLINKYPAHPASQDIVVQLQESLNLANRAAEFDQYLSLFKQANPDAKGIEQVEFEALKGVFFAQQYEKAIQLVPAFLASYPESIRASEARYYLAESYYRQKNFNLALPVFREAATDPMLPLLNRVYARVGELELRAGNRRLAMASYRQLERIASNKKDLYTAWSALMESCYALGLFDSVTYYAQQIEERANVNAGALNRAALYRGKALMGEGRYDEAKDELIQTVNAAQDENGAEAKYLLGEIFFLSKEHKRCFETLIDFNATYPAYTEWVGRSFLLLADNYVATGETFQARATLQSLADSFPIESIRLLARQRLQKLDTDQQQPVPADTIEKR